MNIIADLHVHSRFARACSKNLSIDTISKFAKIKGIQLMGTGDFQHPEWLKELKSKLTPAGEGIFHAPNSLPFALTTEISLMYSQGGKGRRIHLVTLAPDFSVVDQIVEALLKKGRLDYDGRPIFGMSAIEYVELMHGISRDIEIIPAHAWTPWFGIFGSKSGFDSLQECFQEKTKHIHAIETGISSDPAMNWRLSQLDDISIVSFSDLHSYWPWRLGREVTTFEMKKWSYVDLLKAIRENKVIETIEFFPEEGKYHYDGHRNCGVVMPPDECKKLNDLCPVCSRQLTVGVAHRVEELADRPVGSRHKNSKPFVNLIPLAELIAHSLGTPISSKKTLELYFKLVEACGDEFTVLRNTPAETLNKLTDPQLTELILKNREQKITFLPGFDGVYGVPVFESITKAKITQQKMAKQLSMQSGKEQDDETSERSGRKSKQAQKNQKSLSDF